MPNAYGRPSRNGPGRPRSCSRRASTGAIACRASGGYPKLPGVKLRKIVLADGTSYWLRPSFVTSYMTGTVEELAYPLLLAAHGVPPGC